MNHFVLYLQYTNPANYPPLEHSGLILLNARWDVRYFGIQSEGESNKLSFPEPLAGCVTLWKHQSPGLKQKLHFVSFTLMAVLRALWPRPAWVYCSDLMSCPAAWLIGRLTQCRVLYHEHDSPDDGRRTTDHGGAITRQLTTDHGTTGPGGGELEAGRWSMLRTSRTEETSYIQHRTSNIEHSEGGGRRAEDGGRTTETEVSGQWSVVSGRQSAFQRFLLWTRQCVGREADLVILPNQKRLELFCQTTQRQRTSLCVFNCPRKEEVMPAKAEAKTGGKLRLAFHGSINRDRLPLAMLEAMSRFPGRVHLSVVGYETVGIKGYMTEFLQTAESLGLGKAVEFIGALPRHEIFSRLQSAMLGWLSCLLKALM